MQNQLNPITLLIGRINEFQKVIQSDRLQALHLLQAYQQNIEKGASHYQGKLNSDFSGNGCRLDFKSIQNALDCAFYIHNLQKEQGSATSLFLMNSTVASTLSLKKDFPSQIYIHNSLKVDLQNYSGRKINLTKDSDNDSLLMVDTVKNYWNRRKKYILTAISAIALVMLILIPKLKSIDSLNVEAWESNQKKSIAILPFTDRSEEVDSFFSEGIIDDIRTHLSKLDGLKVISRTSSNQYKDTPKKETQIAEELGVQYLLEGSIRQWDDQIKISVQLIDVFHDEQVWGETYERQLEDVFSIQSEVAKSIASSLSQNISPAISNTLDRPPTTALQAYQELMASRELNRIRTQESMEESLNRLDLALSIDPNFVDAMAEKSATLHVMGSLGYSSNRDSSDGVAEGYALQAIKIDPFNARAYATLGNIYFDSKKFKQAQTAFQIAIQHNPNDALVNYWYSLILRYLGRIDDAIYYGNIAAELDPLYPVIQTGYALTCMMGDRMDLARQIIDKGAVMYQNYFGYHWILGYYYMCTEEYEKAIETFNKSQELSPAITSIQRQIMFCKGKIGEVDEVEAYIKTLTGDDGETYINLASAYCGLGRNEECIKNLKLLAEFGMTAPGDIYNVKFRDVINDEANRDFLDQLNQVSLSVD